jgi:hypothetical protein
MTRSASCWKRIKPPFCFLLEGVRWVIGVLLEVIVRKNVQCNVTDKEIYSLNL